MLVRRVSRLYFFSFLIDFFGFSPPPLVVLYTGLLTVVGTSDGYTQLVAI